MIHCRTYISERFGFSANEHRARKFGGPEGSTSHDMASSSHYISSGGSSFDKYESAGYSRDSGRRSSDLYASGSGSGSYSSHPRDRGDSGSYSHSASSHSQSRGAGRESGSLTVIVKNVLLRHGRRPARVAPLTLARVHSALPSLFITPKEHLYL